MQVSWSAWGACLLLLRVASLGAADADGLCEPPRLANGRTRLRPRSRLARFACMTGYTLIGTRYATCANGVWDLPPPVCVKSGCGPMRNVMNGFQLPTHDYTYIIFFCRLGYQLTGSSVVYCDGRRWNASAPVCVDSSSPPKLSCDFESADWCGWRNDEFHDFDWRLRSKKTPSSPMNTGPSYDHTLGRGNSGHYLYVESTSRIENETARLLSPVYEAWRSRRGCFSFYYHMFGKTTGSLLVYQKPVSVDLTEARSAHYRLFQLSGNRGDSWHRGVVDLLDLHEDFQLVVEGVRGSSYTSDIALDDVEIISDNTACYRARLTAPEPRAPPPADTALDSCSGRCGAADMLSELGDMFECTCTASCLLDESCCADYRDICIFPDDSTTPSEARTSSEAAPQTAKLVAPSARPPPPDTHPDNTGQGRPASTTPHTAEATQAAASARPRSGSAAHTFAAVETSTTRTTTTARAPTSTPATTTPARTQTSRAKSSTTWHPGTYRVQSAIPMSSATATVTRTTRARTPHSVAPPRPQAAPAAVSPRAHTAPRAVSPRAHTASANVSSPPPTAPGTVSTRARTTQAAASPHAHTTQSVAPSRTRTTFAAMHTGRSVHPPLSHNITGWLAAGVFVLMVAAVAAVTWRLRRFGWWRHSGGGARAADEVRYLTSHDHLDMEQSLQDT